MLKWFRASCFCSKYGFWVPSGRQLVLCHRFNRHCSPWGPWYVVHSSGNTKKN